MRKEAARFYIVGPCLPLRWIAELILWDFGVKIAAGMAITALCNSHILARVHEKSFQPLNYTVHLYGLVEVVVVAFILDLAGLIDYMPRYVRCSSTHNAPGKSYYTNIAANKPSKRIPNPSVNK